MQNLRNHLERHRNVVAPILVIAVIAMAFYVWKSFGTGHQSVLDTDWIYNLDTQKLTKLPAGEAVAPITLDDGMGYLAFVYTCDSCEGEGRRVAYLVKYTEEASDNTPNSGVASASDIEFVASLANAQSNQWIEGNLSSKGLLMQEAAATCPDTFKVCIP